MTEKGNPVFLFPDEIDFYKEKGFITEKDGRLYLDGHKVITKKRPEPAGSQ